MRLRRAVLSVFFAFLCAATAAARPIHIPRHPDYHDGKIVFSYLGDLWLVREDGTDPRRLTVHTARDVHPRFSPDGRWIAFSSDRYGNLDVFVMPAEGGEPKQLTFHSAPDTVVGWSRDSRQVVFSSSRGRVYPGIPSLYEVSIEGGLEQPLPTDWGYWASYSPDGKQLAFNRHPMVWWRKHYRGAYAADLWVADLDQRRFRKLLDEDVPDGQKPNNFWPMFGNGEIYFVSDRAVTAKAGQREALRSTHNIWKVPAVGGTPTQVTHHESGSLFHPSISSDGRVIVYEEGFGLWKLDTATGKTVEVKPDIASDWKENELRVVTIKDEADSFDLSPSTKRAAISAHGEIFTIATDRGAVSRVTHSYSRETRPQWSPDGKRIAYVSDQTGRDEVWVSDADGGSGKRLSDADTEKLALTWSPDSRSLAYTASDHKLHLVDVAGGADRVLASNEVASLLDPDVSPDGKWIAYTTVDRDLRPHVAIVATAGVAEHRLDAEALFSSSGARFTPDGRRLVFLGGYVQGGAATLRQNAAGVYSVSLAREEKDPLTRDIDDEEAAAAAERSGGEREQRAERERREAPAETRIDWDGLERRIRPVTRLSENVLAVVVAPDSRTYALVTTSEVDGRPATALYAIQENGDQLRRLTQHQPPADVDAPAGGPPEGISSPQFSKDSRTVFFKEGDAIWSVPVGGTEAPSGGSAAASRGAEASRGSESARAGDGGRRKVSFTVRVEVDGRAERKQVFEEAWRIMKNRFYDAEMHGADWAHARAVYEPLLADVADRDELQNVVSQMIGELNASHTGISGGGDPDAEALQTRHPGFELEPDASGYYRVSYVYKRGPADKDWVRVKAGDYVLAVDGVPLKSGENYWRHYTLAPGRKLEFTVNSRPAAEGAWKTRIDPASPSAYATLQYERWVDERRQTVDRLSNGEIGYLHIRAMNQSALRKFERDLADNHFKKGLIIDQRFNPGGGIDQELLELLQQRQYQYTRSRGSVYVTRPQRGFFGPMVVMQNERSTSDAEVFPEGFRTLKLGKTVGMTTYGAVIGTGSYRLMDGSQIRTPGTGLWNVSGTNLENFGVPPDVMVDNRPEDFLKGRDAQLEKAVDVVREEIRRLGDQKVPGR